MAKVKGIEGLTPEQIAREVSRGGKFVVFQYCISIIVVTFRRSSDIYFIRAGESSFTKGIGFTILSFFFGWWGIPWGPIYTIQSIYRNFAGGKDVTSALISAMNEKGETAVNF